MPIKGSPIENLKLKIENSLKNQSGFSGVILPLFLLAAIGISVYLVQQRTNLIPFAQENNPPNGCVKITPQKRFVRYKNCTAADKSCADTTNLLPSTGEQDVNKDFTFDGKIVAGYPLKETVWEWTNGWKSYGTKGPRLAKDNGKGDLDPANGLDGDRITISKGRFDSPGGKGYEQTDSDGLTNGVNKSKYGGGVIVEFSYDKLGTNLQGVSTPGTRTYDPSRTYAFAPQDPNSNVKCDGGGGNGGGATGSKKNGETCDPNQGSQCKSGVCSNSKCVQGSKKGDESCRNPEECQSNTCTNGKCAGGSTVTGRACDEDSDCASNKCDSKTNKCVSVTASKSPSPTPRASGAITPSPTGGDTWQEVDEPRCIAACAGTFPSGAKCFFNQARNMYNCSGVAPSPIASPTAIPTGAPPVVTLTKAEITGFKGSFDALFARLGTAKDNGNLKIVSTIANTELTSIVSQLPSCPDDANVGTCVDSKFRTRFDLAKTAARLSAFYAIFNSIPGLCVKADIGLNPLITATSQAGTPGRVNLCSDRLVATKIWMIFIAGKFSPILSTDSRFPANPTCASLPADVLSHYRNAESLFKTQAGFIQNTVCDGKTTVAPGGGI